MPGMQERNEYLKYLVKAHKHLFASGPSGRACVNLRRGVRPRALKRTQRETEIRHLARGEQAQTGELVTVETQEEGKRSGMNSKGLSGWVVRIQSDRG